MPGFERAARRNPGPSSLSQASYLSGCGKVLAAHYRSGESRPFQGRVLQNHEEVNIASILMTSDLRKMV